MMKKLYSILGLLLLMLAAETGQGYSQPSSQKISSGGLPLISSGIAMASPMMQIQNDSSTTEKIDKKAQQIKQLFSFDVILSILIILIATYFLVRVAAKVIDNLSEKSPQYRLTIKRLIPILRILMWIVAIYIIIAGVIDPDVSTLITVAASVGIAVGLAAQGILKNIFGGIIIILDRPFQVGDKIAFGDYYGEVQQIGLRSTRLVTPDDSVVSLPNGEVIGDAVSNANSGEINCQVVAEIYLPATTDIAVAKQIARKAALSSQYVYLKKPIVIIAVNEVHEKNFVIKLRVKAYVLDIRFEFPFQSDMTEQITTELDRRALLPPAEMVG